MSRLQTKCVIASATAHGLLLALVVVSAAFVKAPAKQEDVHFVKIFRDSQVTDAATQGGGNPLATAEPAPPQSAPPVQQDPPTQITEPVVVKKVDPPAQPKKQPPKKTPPPKIDPPKPAPEEKITKNQNSTKVVPKKNLVEKPPEKKIDVDLSTVKVAKADPAAQKLKEQREREIKEAKEREEADRKAAIRAQMEAADRANKEYKQRMAALGSIVGKVEDRMSGGVAVEMPKGDGGIAFINYADLIYAKYYEAWQTPQNRDSRSSVKVEITVARDGRVISANIIKPSGDSQLDKSVRQALDRVPKLPAFPETAKDAQRTFRINFELKSKRQFG